MFILFWLFDVTTYVRIQLCFAFSALMEKSMEKELFSRTRAKPSAVPLSVYDMTIPAGLGRACAQPPALKVVRRQLQCTSGEPPKIKDQRQLKEVDHGELRAVERVG